MWTNLWLITPSSTSPFSTFKAVLLQLISDKKFSDLFILFHLSQVVCQLSKSWQSYTEVEGTRSFYFWGFLLGLRDRVPTDAILTDLEFGNQGRRGRGVVNTIAHNNDDFSTVVQHDDRSASNNLEDNSKATATNLMPMRILLNVTCSLIRTNLRKCRLWAT